MADSELTIFCRQVRMRSQENGKALQALHHNGLLGNLIGVLRQELDSMVRCIFLLSITDKQYRDQLIHDSVSGNAWRSQDGRRKITDKDMVNLSNNPHGWTQDVYKFGCGFIHLSAYHDYSERDPFDSLTPEDRRNIADHIQYYHGVMIDNTTKLRDIEFVLPGVFKKISDNLECYVRDLETGADLRP